MHISQNIGSMEINIVKNYILIPYVWHVENNG